MRSLIVAPADEKQLARALASGAGALIVDLAQAAPGERVAARTVAAGFLNHSRARSGGPALIVGVNALDSGETDADLDAIMAAAPRAILLPRSLGGASVQQLSAKLAVREAVYALADGSTRIIVLADTAQGLLSMGSYRGSSGRLAGIAWSAGSVCADIGAERCRDEAGGLLGPYRLARVLVLLAATAAGVAAIDAVFGNLGNAESLRAEAVAARRDGFSAKLTADPSQALIINEAFAAATGGGDRRLELDRIEHTNP